MLLVKLCSNKVNKSRIRPFLNVSMSLVITSTMNITLLTSCLCILTIAIISEARNVYMADTEPNENTAREAFITRCYACSGKETKDENGVIVCPQRCVEEEKLDKCEYLKCLNQYCPDVPGVPGVPDDCKM